MGHATSSAAIAQLLEDVRRECGDFEESLQQFFRELDESYNEAERAITAAERVLFQEDGTPENAPIRSRAASEQITDLRRAIEHQTELITRWMEQNMDLPETAPAP